MRYLFKKYFTYIVVKFVRPETNHFVVVVVRYNIKYVHCTIQKKQNLATRFASVTKFTTGITIGRVPR